MQDVKQADSLGACLQQQATYESAFSIVLAAQQFCTEVGEALIMIFVGMIAPDGVGVNSSQALLRWFTPLHLETVCSTLTAICKMCFTHWPRHVVISSFKGAALRAEFGLLQKLWIIQAYTTEKQLVTVSRHITMLLDQMHILDVLKTAKVSLADGIAMARHAQQQHTSTSGQQHDQEEDEPDVDGMLEFLEDPWWCVKMLHSSTKQVNYQHRVVGRLVQYICESLTDKVQNMFWAKIDVTDQPAVSREFADKFLLTNFCILWRKCCKHLMPHG